ncbi:MAG TPA: carboxypeptidase regulatory-like domain-containing protein [Gemmatimonadaceae bacterium]
MARLRGILPLLAFVAGPGLASAQSSATTGRVEGVVSISERLITPRMRVRVYDEPGGAPPRPPSTEHRFAGVVLYLQPVERGSLRGAAARQPATTAPALRQRDERFTPHVLPVLAGTTVEFPNDDDVFHNVFSLSSARTFDLGRYARGSSRSVTFPTAGVVQVFCHIHADMSGIVLVLDNPFYVVPDANGRFVIDGVPPGAYQLVAWHERIKPMYTPVRVDAGRAAPVRLRIPLPREPGEQ